MPRGLEWDQAALVRGAKWHLLQLQRDEQQVPWGQMQVDHCGT